jgi:uncharacterized protein YbjT (DUF2867 family)
MTNKAILVTGATGKQGGAVVNALLESNSDFEILALTRNASSPSAQKLTQKSSKIKLVTGNLDALDEVFQTAQKATNLPIWGVFSVQVAIGDGHTAITEERQGKALIDAALTHGVKHFVYSSVDRGGAASETSPTTVPHFISKHAVEQHLFAKAQGSGMSYTVLRPVAFFEDLSNDFVGKVFASSYAAMGQKSLQMIATSDIGFFAAQAFLKPEEYKGVRLSIAGDELTFAEFKNVFENTTGKKLPMTWGFVAGFVNMMVKDLGLMFKWFGEVGYGANVEASRRIHPGLKNFKTWLEEESAWKKN